ncbi:hypothetical protein RRG08_051627 [Elysia crispata]|uniref:Uncharacterized protein n=1 Tax=Elysia crispata TaxID=231223 RepID=A0AAE1DRG1_9GAST|nr:hypothetical protein RRG08_051627 [Elysia crispata]
MIPVSFRRLLAPQNMTDGRIKSADERESSRGIGLHTCQRHALETSPDASAHPSTVFRVSERSWGEGEEASTAYD